MSFVRKSDMSTLVSVSSLVLLTRSIAVLPTSIDICDPQESPINESEESRLLVTPHQTDSRRGSWCSAIGEQDTMSESQQYQIGDCLGASLEYFGNKTDIQSFRKTSRCFDSIHRQYQIRQNARFRNFRVLFQNDSQQNKYQSIDHLLHSIPLVPDVYLGSNKSDFQGLFHLHRRFGQEILRGLVTRRNHPFISVLLWNDEDWRQDPMVLICLFPNGFMRAALFTQNGTLNRTILVCHKPSFGAAELNELLCRRYIHFADDSKQTALWTIGKRCCSLHVQRLLCVLTGVGASILLSVGYILYLLVANHERLEATHTHF